jgi:glycosyltransferase involved in cell wall biosynthesis
MSDLAGKTKILLVSPLPPPRGGIGTWTELILQEAALHPDLEIRLVNTSPTWRKALHLEVWRRALGGSLQLFKDIALVLAALIRFKPQVLHLCTSAYIALVRDLFILALARLSGVPAVYHVRMGRLPELARSRGWEWRLFCRTIALARQVIVLDQASLDTLRAHFPGKPALKIPNCGSSSAGPAAPPAANELPKIIFIGWIVPYKGVLELVQAAAQIAAQADFVLELVGPYNSAYIEKVRQAGGPLGERLILTGEAPHEQAMQRLGGADILALPSHTEGFPNVILEAMALGKPVVGTDVGAVRELLLENGPPSGLVVPPKDARALAGALLHLLQHEGLRREMGQAGLRKFAALYTAPAVFGQLKQLWQNLLQPPPQS